MQGFVVGISGGVDSALCSTLAAMTGRKVVCVSLPIHQAAAQVSRGDEHIAWLKGKFANVESAVADLTEPYEAFLSALPKTEDVAKQQLTETNTRSRLRMTALYYYAGLSGLLVVGISTLVITLTTPAGFSAAAKYSPEMGVAAMAVSLAVVPIVSLITPKLKKETVDAAFDASEVTEK